MHYAPLTERCNLETEYVSSSYDLIVMSFIKLSRIRERRSITEIYTKLSENYDCVSTKTKKWEIYQIGYTVDAIQL